MHYQLSRTGWQIHGTRVRGGTPKIKIFLLHIRM